MAGSLRHRSTSRSTGMLTLERSQYFQFTHVSLEGYENLLRRKLENNAAFAEYTLSTSIFSITKRQFIGRFLDSMPCDLMDSLERGAVVCPINQASFFYSNQTDSSLVLITELNASYLSEDTDQSLCLGWAMMSVFDHSIKAATEDGVVRLPLYEGTPRMLFSMPLPVTDPCGVVPIPGCILACSLCPHPILARGAHLFPPNVPITYQDEIPGLVPTTVHEAFPKLAGTTSGVFDKASLLLLPSVDDFEHTLLTQLEEDLSCEEGGGAAIEERRMKFACYNGWTFIGSPLVGYMEKITLTSKTSLFRTTPPSLSSLAFRGSLELGDVITHTSTEVVLLLEYVVSWKESDKKHTTTLTVGWGVWLPFDSEYSLEQEVCVSLDLKAGGGHTFQPPYVPVSAYKACYENGLRDVGKVTFKFSPHGSTNHPLSSTQVVTPSHEGMVQSQVVSAMPTPDHHEGVDYPDRGGDSPDHPAVPMSSTSVARGMQVGVELQQEGVELQQEEVELQQEGVELQHDEEEQLKPKDAPVDVKCIGGQNPVVTMATRSAHSVSRPTLAYLHVAGPQCLCDAKGTPIPEVDLGKVAASLATPLATPHSTSLSTQPCRIAVQLLAFGPPKREFEDLSAGGLVLTYQFFCSQRITTSCQLFRPPDVGKSLPYILQNDTNGNMHVFPVSHLSPPPPSAHLSSPPPPGGLLHYLASGHLHVDLYHGPSHILIGSALVPLKFLLYQEEEWFQVTLSALVMFPEVSTDSNVPVVPMPSSVGLASAVGKLYMRLGRLPPDNRDLVPMPFPVIASEPLSNQISLARRLYEHPSTEKSEDEETRRRKLARMQFIRLNMDHSSSGDGGGEDLKPRPSTVPGSTPTQGSVVDVQRHELRYQRVAAVLEEHISSAYLLQAPMGTAVYFEHQFRNTLSRPLNMTISWRDPELKLVRDRLECQLLRELHFIQTPIDDNLITDCLDTGQYGFFVHPNETVRLPFKYQSFSVPRRACQDGEETAGHQFEQKIIKVYLQTSHKDTLAVLTVHVHPTWHRVDQVFNFYHPQGTFMKKYFELKHVTSSGDDGDEFFAATSDHDNTCEIRHRKDGTPCCFVKASVTSGPQSTFFFVMIYNQKYAFCPVEIWQVFVHPAYRVDHSLTLGQSSTIQLSLHGNSIDRRVNCYSLSGPVIKVVTPSPFLLVNHTLSTVQVTLKTYSHLKSTMIVTAVDMDSQQLLNTWLVHMAVLEPAVAKAFKVSLPVGGAKSINKTITFTNPYSKTKEFLLHTNSPECLSFGSSALKLCSKQTGIIVLQFAPSSIPLSFNILVFINDELDQTEECFLVNAVYM